MLQISFIVITFLSLWLFYKGTGSIKNILLVSIALLFIIGIISFSGFLQNTKITPPRFLMILIPVFFTFIFFYKTISKTKIKLEYLLAIHALRMPVELVLYFLFLNKKIPKIMTFAGWNYDILIGISATTILFYLLISRKKLNQKFMIIWNFAGILFLFTIVIIAILSAPFPFQKLAFDQPNIAVLEFPYTFLPTFVVPIVFLSHLLLLNTNYIQKIRLK